LRGHLFLSLVSVKQTMLELNRDLVADLLPGCTFESGLSDCGLSMSIEISLYIAVFLIAEQQLLMFEHITFTFWFVFYGYLGKEGPLS
jgi:hypothetical protein